MNSGINIKSYIVQVICLLYVLLFVYAAVSKLLDFENFQVQLGQSPLLSAFAAWIGWLVPLIEIIIAVLLMIPKVRTIGLFGAFNLMVMFTAYIFIILNYSSFVPCSCGGILEKMSWRSHLTFNILFVLLACFALILQSKEKKGVKINKTVLSIFLSFLLSSSFIAVLFLSSEEIIHYKNPFLRRYDRRAISFVDSEDLKFNSYYFSGYSNGNLYMGNYSTPLRILAVDSTLKLKKEAKIDFENRSIPFRSIKIVVRDKYFYLMDGTVPCVYFGNTANWKVEDEIKNVPRFTTAQAVDTSIVIFRNNNGLGSANIIGQYDSKNNPKIRYSQTLLQKQIDGIFDTDGMLNFDSHTGKMVYVYFYRNEFIVADKNIFLLNRGHTIDTISKAQIKVAALRDGTRKKMAIPPTVVNSQSAIIKNLLFIESQIQGLYEDQKVWKYASIIDVYNLDKKSYVLSFPVFGIGGNKLQSFLVTETNLYALVGSRLTVYKFNKRLKEEMQ